MHNVITYWCRPRANRRASRSFVRNWRQLRHGDRERDKRTRYNRINYNDTTTTTTTTKTWVVGRAGLAHLINAMYIMHCHLLKSSCRPKPGVRTQLPNVMRYSSGLNLLTYLLVYISVYEVYFTEQLGCNTERNRKKVTETHRARAQYKLDGLWWRTVGIAVCDLDLWTRDLQNVIIVMLTS